MNLGAAHQHSAELAAYLETRVDEFAPPKLRTEGLPTEAFAATMTSVEHFLLEDAEVVTHITAIINAIEFKVDHVVALEYAIRRLNSSSAQLPKDDAQILGMFYLLAVKPCQDAIRLAMQKVCQEHPDIDPVEKKIAAAGYQIGPLFDDLFLERWWPFVVVPFRTSQLTRNELKDLITRVGKTNKYSILADGPTGPHTDPLTGEFIERAVEVPLATICPVEIMKIVEVMRKLVAELPDDYDDYRQYFLALALALENEDLEKMEALWLKVDNKWVRISSNRLLIPVHMMEYDYIDPIRVMPDFRLMWRTNDYRTQLAIMRAEMRDLSAEIDPFSVGKIDRTDVGVFQTILNSGSTSDVRYAGQSVPNRPEAQAVGMRVFLDKDTMARRLTRFQHLIQQVLDPDSLAWAETHLRMEFLYLLVFGHEFGHPFCVDDDLIKAFGDDKPRVEELKATLLGIEGIRRAIVHNRFECTSCSYARLIVIIVARVFGMLEANNFNNPAVGPYVNESMAILDLLMGAGFIQITEQGKLKIVRSFISYSTIADRLFEFVKKLIGIYRRESREDVLSFVEIFCQRQGENVQLTYKAINDNIKA